MVVGVCEQLARLRYVTMKWPEGKTVTSRPQVRHPND